MSDQRTFSGAGPARTEPIRDYWAPAGLGLLIGIPVAALSTDGGPGLIIFASIVVVLAYVGFGLIVNRNSALENETDGNLLGPLDGERSCLYSDDYSRKHCSSNMPTGTFISRRRLDPRQRSTGC